MAQKRMGASLNDQLAASGPTEGGNTPMRMDN
jgi:hypothetical protein